MSVHSASAATYDSKGRLLRHTHDSLANREGNIYVGNNSDDSTDGSFRWITGPDDVTRIEKRTEGVWNATELQLAGTSLFLGRDVSLSVIGHQLLVVSAAEQSKHVMVSTEFNDTDGSFQPHAQVFAPRITRFIQQSDLSVDTLSSTHIFSVTPTVNVVSYVIYAKVGSIAPTAPVDVLVTVGPARPVYSRVYPASQFPANAEVLLQSLAGISFRVGELITLTFSSADAFSLLGDVTPTPWIAVDFQTFTTEEVVTENVYYDKDLNPMLDNNLNPIYMNHF